MGNILQRDGCDATRLLHWKQGLIRNLYHIPRCRRFVLCVNAVTPGVTYSVEPESAVQPSNLSGADLVTETPEMAGRHGRRMHGLRDQRPCVPSFASVLGLVFALRIIPGYGPISFSADIAAL